MADLRSVGDRFSVGEAQIDTRRAGSNSANMSSRPPAGWYKNPNNPLQEQYWDGQRWSGVFRATPPGRPVAVFRLDSIEHLEIPGIRRVEYAFKFVIVTLLAMVGLSLSVFLRPASYSPLDGISEAGAARLNFVFVVVFLASWLIYTLILRVIAKKRVANAGFSAVFNRLMLIPYLQTLIAIALVLLPPRASRDMATDVIRLRVRSHSEGEAKMLAASDLRLAKTAGYRQEDELWIPGRWSKGDFLLAALVALTVIGILVILAMLMIKPKGTLFITLRIGGTPADLAGENGRAAPAGTKTCPRCAEDVKAAALVCRFCGHSFTPA